MAVGDVVSDLQSKTTGLFLDIQPAAGVEWVIHNLYWNANVTIEFFDGTNSIVFDSPRGPGTLAKFQFHVNNIRRIRVKADGATTLIGWDGVQTK
jgi:hypothetical protein